MPLGDENTTRSLEPTEREYPTVVARLPPEPAFELPAPRVEMSIEVDKKVR